MTYRRNLAREILSRYSARVRARKLVMALIAYVDDSTSNVGDRRLVLAGYVNTAERWAEFSDDWEAELGAGRPVGYLKMSEAMSRRGEFDGWAPDDIDAKLTRLFEVIRRQEGNSFHVSISSVDVSEVLVGVVPYGMSTPYFWAFQTLVVPLAIKWWQEVGGGPPISFIFDQQEGQGLQAKYAYSLIRDTLSEESKPALEIDPQFLNEKDALPLQAADAIAWFIRKNLESRDTRQPPLSLFSGERHTGMDFTRDQLFPIAAFFKAQPGFELMAQKNYYTKNMKRLMASGGLSSAIRDSDVHCPQGLII